MCHAFSKCHHDARRLGIRETENRLQLLLRSIVPLQDMLDRIIGSDGRHQISQRPVVPVGSNVRLPEAGGHGGPKRFGITVLVAGTITVKMAPRVKKLWDLMPEPKWCIAMGSCAISGDFYRDLYPTVPGIDTFLPVDVYVPGCPPNPEALMAGMLRLQEKVRLQRAGKWTQKETRPETAKMIMPALRRLGDPARDPKTDEAQLQSAMKVAGSDPLLEAPTAPRPATTSDTQVSPDGDLEAMLRAHGVSEFPKDAPPLVPVDRHRDLAQALKKKGFRQLVTVVASHYPGEKDSEGNVKKPEQYEVMYGLRTTGKGSQLALWRVRFESPDGIDSLYGVFAGADWQEREQFDLVGVRFAGHPDLRRILLPHDYSGFPLRRDHAADAVAQAQQHACDDQPEQGVGVDRDHQRDGEDHVRTQQDRAP